MFAKLTGWQLIVLTGMLLAAPIILVQLGQELSAVVSVGLVIAAALGVPIAQGVVNYQRVSQVGAKVDKVETLANGNLTALREQLAEQQEQANQRLMALQLEHNRTLAELHERMLALATLVPPGSALPDPIHLDGREGPR